MVVILKQMVLRGKSLVIFLYALVLSGCTLTLTYNYLDWVLPWYLDDYVTLTHQQEKLLDQATLEFLDWHRTEELPRYAQFFSTIREAQTTPMNRQQVLFFFDEAANLWTVLLSESMPEILLLARQLSDKQLEEIDESLANSIEKLQDKFGERTDAEQRHFWQEKMLDSLDEWLGSVTEIQKESVKQWSKIRINTTDEWLVFRTAWRNRFMTLMTLRHQRNFSEEMDFFLLHPKSMYSDTYLSAVSKNRLSFAQLIADLSSTLTPKQRAYLQKELTGVITDLHALSRQKG